MGARAGRIINLITSSATFGGDEQEAADHNFSAKLTYCVALERKVFIDRRDWKREMSG